MDTWLNSKEVPDYFVVSYMDNSRLNVKQLWNSGLGQINKTYQERQSPPSDGYQEDLISGNL